jgi:hypothetical protein
VVAVVQSINCFVWSNLLELQSLQALSASLISDKSIREYVTVRSATN